MQIRLKVDNKKNTRLTRTKRISLEKKIQILEEFSAKHDEKIEGNTIFHGYPIGRWVIQIRSDIKSMNDGTSQVVRINPTEDQLERLNKLGILEGQLISIDEKIEDMLRWRKIHPELPFRPSVPLDEISDERICKEYERLLNYYEYVQVRFKKGALSGEQITKCREGCVGGCFGFSTKEIEENAILMSKFGFSEETISAIINKYGSIDNFRSLYIQKLLNNQSERFEAENKTILNGVSLIKRFDIDSQDWVLRRGRFAELADELLGLKDPELRYNYYFIRYQGIEECLGEIIKGNNFSPKEKETLELLFSRSDSQKLTYSKVAQERKVTIENVRQRFFSSLRKFKLSVYKEKLDLVNRVLPVDYDFFKEVVEEFFKTMDIFEPKEPINMDETVKERLLQMVYLGVKNSKKRDEDVAFVMEMPLEQRLEILRERFGERIKDSDLVIASPSSKLRKKLKSLNDGLDISSVIMEIEAGYNSYLEKELYRECVDSDYTQNKILVYMMEKSTDDELLEEGKIEQIAARIDSNGGLDEDRKRKIKNSLNARVRVLIKTRVVNQLENWKGSSNNPVSIEELELGYRSYNQLRIAGIKTINDLLKFGYEEFTKIRNLGDKSIKEIVGRLEDFGVEIREIDGSKCFYAPNLISNSEYMLEVENSINNYGVLGEEEKRELKQLLYEKFVNMATEEETNSFIESRPEYKNSIQRALIAKVLKEKKEKAKEAENPLIRIESIQLASTTYESLNAAGIETIPQLIGLRMVDLVKMKNMRRESIENLIDSLNKLGLEMIDDQLVFTNRQSPRTNTSDREEDRVITHLSSQRKAIGEQEGEIASLHSLIQEREEKDGQQ